MQPTNMKHNKLRLNGISNSLQRLKQHNIRENSIRENSLSLPERPGVKERLSVLLQLSREESTMLRSESCIG